MRSKKRIVITFFSIILILFGFFGTAGSLAGIYLLGSKQEELSNIQEMSLSVASVIEETSEMLGNSDATTSHIAESIRITKSSINNASEISYDSGMAFSEIAGVMGFEVLGYKPLESTEEYFEDIGDNLVSLSEDLGAAEDSLEVNAADMERIGRDLEGISIELKEVSEKLNQVIDSFDINNITMIIRYLLIYLAVFHIIFILNGIIFLSLRR